jgi:DNA-directed RNA polymerase subunit F
VEDALEKLDALAKRQEDLANQQHNPQQNFQERWQQEMLRREAEQLQRQLEQLARNGQQGSNGSAQDSQQQSSSSQSSRQQPASPSSRSSAGASGDRRIEQALKRLQQATDDMKHNGNPQQSAAGQQAADQLRKASSLLAGTQQQLASGQVSALSREADRLTHEERAQAERINNFAGQQPDPNSTNLDAMLGHLHERDRLAKDRQQLSDDLSNLQRNVREAAREMASAQPGVAQELRDALRQMDEYDLDNRVQRTADWLRRGINPNANGTESEIVQGLAKLNQQLQQAQQNLDQGGSVQRGADKDGQTTALDQLEGLRKQLEAMAPSQDGQRRGQQGQNRAGQNGDVRNGGGHNSDGTPWNNINTGDNRYGQPGPPTASPDTSSNPADTERTFRQSMRALNQLRQMLRDNPEAAKEVAELARQMQLLDPSRFPGNPAMLEQMHREVLSSVDRLELQLQRDAASTQARTGKSSAVPSGYQESVAEYFKRLSKNP